MATGRVIRYEFAWDQDPATLQGRLMFWIDGRPVMRSDIPPGLRPMQDFVVLLNIAMGGNVTQGRTPGDGTFPTAIFVLR